MSKVKKTILETSRKITKKEIEVTVSEGYVCFHNIKWDTDGEKVELPKTIAVPKEDFEPDFDFDAQSADFLSDRYDWCIKSLEISK